MKKLLVVCSFLLLSGLANATKTLIDNTNHFLSYELKNDSLYFSFEFLTDINFNDDILDSASLDYLIFQFDHNQNDILDQNSNVDLYFMYDQSLLNNTCAGYLVTGNTLGSCGSFSTNSKFNVEVSSSVQQAVPHLIFSFVIPQNELFTGSHVCTRLSVIAKSTGQPISQYPSANTNKYFVDNYYPIQLFQDPDLGEDKSICGADTIRSNVEYPFQYWNNVITDDFVVVTETGKVNLVVQDNTCVLSDEIEIKVNSEEFCEGKYFIFPNVITPNNDGRNDLFEPIITDELLENPELIKGSELFIYNRWGALVNKSVDFPSWDGYTDTGNIAASGTYFYVFKSNSEANILVNGFFNLIQ